MLSAKQRRIALKKNIEHARDMARRLRADGADEITLTYYADEESFRAMKLPEEGDDFEYRQLVTTEFARVMLAHGLHLKVQVLDAKEYFEWLGTRENTYQASMTILVAGTCPGMKPWRCSGSSSRADPSVRIRSGLPCSSGLGRLRPLVRLTTAAPSSSRDRDSGSSCVQARRSTKSR